MLVLVIGKQTSREKKWGAGWGGGVWGEHCILSFCLFPFTPRPLCNPAVEHSRVTSWWVLVLWILTFLWPQKTVAEAEHLKQPVIKYITSMTHLIHLFLLLSLCGSMGIPRPLREHSFLSECVHGKATCGYPNNKLLSLFLFLLYRHCTTQRAFCYLGCSEWGLEWAWILLGKYVSLCRECFLKTRPQRACS